MGGAAIACSLLALFASAPLVRVEAAPRFQPMEQFVFKPLYSDSNRAPARAACAHRTGLPRRDPLLNSDADTGRNAAKSTG
ncbi:hypothetical protein [Paracoccus sp. S1E-3]|uniref:hypothetical protein n=1 Tax=Paracoccus sp. S1E-3 TaxID=2756130 RepID=UPI0015EE9E9D|nr:hypothetical protein [Paracoccus sp. S1E-3]MBA4490278.1 hypothetical protein [Paracoccus sp. S1E-3]